MKTALPKPLLQENLQYGKEKHSTCPYDSTRPVA
jgi:hypothetical protein